MAPIPKVKRTKKVLTLKEKIEIIKSLDNGISACNLKHKYGIGMSTIYDIRKNKEQIISFYAKADAIDKIEKRKTIQSSKNPKVEDALYIWFRQNRSAGVPMSGPLIIEKAKQFHEHLNIETPCNYSRGWLDKFKNRYGIRCVNTAGEQGSSDKVSATLYVSELAEIIETEKFGPEQIYNADETGLFWRSIPRKTLICHDESRPAGTKDSKQRLTVLVCSNAAGTHKCKLFVIGKSAKPRALKGMKHLPVIYTANKRAWMTQELMKLWFQKHFIKETRDHLEKIGLPAETKILLLLDNCPAHPPARELNKEHITVNYLPPNCTPLIQPMDQGVIKSLKCHYRHNQLKSLLAQNSSGDIGEMIKAFTVKDFIYSINRAWTEIPATALKNSWKNIWPELFTESANIANIDVDGCNNDINLEQIVQTAEALENFNVQQITAWLDEDKEASTFASLNDAEIVAEVNNVTECSESSNESEINSDVEVITSDVTISQTITKLQQVIDFAEKQDFVNQQDLMMLEGFKEKLLYKKIQSIKQTSIDKYFKPA